jgi:hypothetical protein
MHGHKAALDTVTAELRVAREALERQSKLLQDTLATNADRLAGSAAREALLREKVEIVQSVCQKAESRANDLEDTFSSQAKNLEAASERTDALQDAVGDVNQGRTKEIEFHVEGTKKTKKWAALGVAALCLLAVVLRFAVFVPQDEGLLPAAANSSILKPFSQEGSAAVGSDERNSVSEKFDLLSDMDTGEDVMEGLLLDLDTPTAAPPEEKSLKKKTWKNPFRKGFLLVGKRLKEGLSDKSIHEYN